MDMACVNKCVKGGKSRSACMRQCYPDDNGKKGKSKKSGSRPPRGGRY